MGGIEKVQFAGNDETGFIFGASYKIVLTDWLTGTVDLRNHNFKREFISDSKTTNNIEMTVGFSALF
jgi:outer membrane beta-barrel protein